MAGTEEFNTQTIQEVRLLMKRRFEIKVTPILNINYLDQLKKVLDSTFLHYCVKHSNNERVVSYLLGQGHPVDVRDSSGATPLMIAVRRKHKVIIETLLAAGADIMLMNNNKKSTLRMSCEEHNLHADIRKLILNELPKKFSNSSEIAQLLIDSGCHLYQAAYLRNAQVLECMLEQNFAVDSTHPTLKQTALHVAVSLGDIDSVKLLLKYGANGHAKDSNDENCLYYLYKYNQEHTPEKIEILKILLELKVSLTSCTSRGLFQISLMLMQGSDQVINMLLQANMDCTAVMTCDKATMLHNLAINKNPGVIEILKYHINKFDVNGVNKFGLNALYSAVACAYVDMVQFLLSQGAVPNCTHNIYNSTPLCYAYTGFKPGLEEATHQCVEMLLHHNADPQVIVTMKSGRKIIVSDIAKDKNILDILKPVIAHLGILEGLEVPITEFTLSRINSIQPMKEYFKSCQMLLKKKILGSVTLFKLLTGDKKRMARYACNKTLILKLLRLSFKQNLKTRHLYYYNTIKKNLSEGITYCRFLNEVAEAIHKISGNYFDKNHLVVNKIIGCLDDTSLKQLHDLSKVLR